VAAVPQGVRVSARIFALAVFVIALGRASSAPTGTAAAEYPRRVVSLVPATTEMLFAMGAGTVVAGVSSYDRYPPEVEKLPKLGGLLDPNVERLLALKPDLAIVYNTQAELKQQLARAGIPVFPYVHRGLSDVTTMIRSLGTRVGFGAQAGALADGIERRLGDIRARVAGRPRPRTLLVFGRQEGTLQNIDASGGYGFLHDMLDIAGGADAVGDITRESVQMSTEMILARAPDVIIELHYGASLTPKRMESERHVWDPLGSIPAVRNGRVYLVVGDEYVVPGPRVAAATERLARLLHPDAFK
jgi:iron complex transport system substrate-binding protein